METKKLVNPTKVITGKDTRWSYCHVWEPKAIKDIGCFPNEVFGSGLPKYTAR